MSKLTPNLIVLLLSVSITVSACANDMFENLKFGDSKKTVQQKLIHNKRLTSPPVTLLSRTSSNGFFKTKKSLAGLKFELHFEWENGAQQTLKTVDLYSTPSSHKKLQEAYIKATILITELYGKSYFNEGLPKVSSIEEEGTIHWGAAWLNNDDAIMLGMGKTSNGLCLVISFKNQHPQFSQTS